MSELKLARSLGGVTQQVDGIVHFKTPDGRQRALHLEAKSVPLRQGHAQRVAASLQRPTPARSPSLLVYAPYIDAPAARVLIDAGVSYVDARGNLHVAIGKQYLAHIERPGAPAKPVTAKGLRPASYRALLAMLVSAENTRATTRALALQAGGVSPQTVTELRAKMHERGLLLKTNRDWAWAPGGFQRSLDLWAHGFADTLAPALHVGRFRARERDPREFEVRIAPKLDQFGDWAWGGGAACDRLTHFYRGDTTVVYLENPSAAWPRDLGLVEDADGPITLMKSPGPGAMGDPGKHVVHPALAYADLLRESEPRAAEAAAEIHAQLLDNEPVR